MGNVDAEPTESVNSGQGAHGSCWDSLLQTESNQQAGGTPPQSDKPTPRLKATPKMESDLGIPQQLLLTHTEGWFEGLVRAVQNMATVEMPILRDSALSKKEAMRLAESAAGDEAELRRALRRAHRALRPVRAPSLRPEWLSRALRRAALPTGGMLGRGASPRRRSIRSRCK